MDEILRSNRCLHSLKVSPRHLLQRGKRSVVKKPVWHNLHSNHQRQYDQQGVQLQHVLPVRALRNTEPCGIPAQSTQPASSHDHIPDTPKLRNIPQKINGLYSSKICLQIQSSRLKETKETGMTHDSEFSSDIKNSISPGWCGSVDWAPASGNKGSLMRFLVRAPAWVAGQVPSRGCARGNYTLIFPSPPFFPCLKINNKVF